MFFVSSVGASRRCGVRYFIEEIFDDPETLTYLRIAEPAGLEAHNAALSAAPSEDRDALHGRLRRATKVARALPRVTSTRRWWCGARE